ncbi:MAG: DUF1080 domain-containing protein [Gemmatimonadota bacterium]
MRPTSSIPLLLATLGGLLPGCTGAAQSTSDPVQSMINRLTPEEEAAGWRLLFNGQDLDGWRVFHGDAPTGWAAVDGELRRVGQGGDLITTEQYANFELALEWKLGPGGNSGILLRVDEASERSYHSGPEMQVLDDEAHRDGLSRLTAAGSNYALHPAPEGVVRPVGEWNQVRIVYDGAHVQHWLNGRKIVEYELWTPEWEALVQGSKFAEWPEYGRATRGHIGLQDHGDAVAYRNIKLLELP